MATINRQSIFLKFEKSPAAGKLKKQLEAQLETQFVAAKRELITSVISHPISEEIAAGPGLETSQILPSNYGNLFSFIGFDSSRKPISQLVELIERNVKAKPAQLANRRGTTIQYFKQIQFPRIKATYKKLSLPRATTILISPGRSSQVGQARFDWAFPKNLFGSK